MELYHTTFPKSDKCCGSRCGNGLVKLYSCELAVGSSGCIADCPLIGILAVLAVEMVAVGVLASFGVVWRPVLYTDLKFVAVAALV